MVRKNNRVILNRATFQEITLAMADGLLALADQVIATARPPDDPPYGVGLVQTGGTVAYAFGKKVGGSAKKPRAIKVKSMGVVVAGGFGWPGHYAEFGTIHEPARPFLTPALMATVPEAGAFVGAAVRQRLATTGARAARGAAIRTRIAAKRAAS